MYIYIGIYVSILLNRQKINFVTLLNYLKIIYFMDLVLTYYKLSNFVSQQNIY